MKKIIKPKPEFLEKMKKLLNQSDFEKYEKILQEPLLNSIRCNTLKISPEQLKKRLEENGWKISQPWKNYPEVMIIEGKFVNEIIDNKIIDKTEINNNLKQISANEMSSKNYRLGRVGGLNEPSQNEQISDRGWASDFASNKYAAAKNAKIDERSREQDGETKSSKKILIDLEPGELGRSIEHLLGYYYVQELASMLSTIALNPKPHELILDLCASPGSKTSQMASQMNNTGTIIANDVNIERIKILASNLERCGIANTIITRENGIQLCEKFSSQKLKFDKILLDAPCSGEGTMRNSPKTCLMWNLNTIKSLSKLQKKLFKSVFEILKKDGEIVYSTCTHAPEENEEVVDFALKEFGDKIEIEEINLPIKCRPGLQGWAGGNYSKEVEKSCRIYPQDNNSEGFFVAKFRRVK